MKKGLREVRRELRKLREAQAEHTEATDEYTAAFSLYEKKVEELRQHIERVLEASGNDPYVVAAADRRDMAMDAVHEAKVDAELAALAYYGEYGFPGGKKTYTDEGCKVSVKEMINRKVTDVELMLRKVREDDVCLQAIVKNIGLTLYRDNFNTWVDLKTLINSEPPPGIEVSNDVTVKVEILSE